jgi:tRNA A64-2'-O-ribosylphosphate transferase
MTMPPLTQADLIFSPQANHNFSHILSDLKRSNLSIHNRLRSIKQDSLFVTSLASLYGLPLVANERCGSWYIPPAVKAASAYFKSTDGHVGQWSFSTRRLNLHLLELIGDKGGCIVVDSTRRGKRMPDALSKTVPVWCCVMNRVVFPEAKEWHALYTPPSAVGESEKSQIEARIDAFVEAFLALGVDLAGIRGKLDKPLRPIWRTQDDGLPEEQGMPGNGYFYPVVCCTSSRRVIGAEMSEGGYIQGAGDDTENWAHGLTAQIWWRHEAELLETSEGDLPGMIGRLVNETNEEGGENGATRLTDVLYVSALPVAEHVPGTCLVRLFPEVTEKETWLKSKLEMEVGIGKSKTGARNLRHALPAICEFVQGFLAVESGASAEEMSTRGRVIVACETGKDLSVGTALALDCWCFDDNARPRLKEDENASFTKTAIRVRLGRIMTAMPEANPSRTTLQSVNSFLMDWQR